VARALGPAALLLATGAALAGWTWGTWPDVVVDFGRELYVPWRLVAGDVLYRDLAYLNGPLSPHWNALWFRLLGVGLSTLVWVNLALLAVATGLLHRLLAAISDRGSATIACGVFLLVFAFGQYLPTGNYNWVTPYSHEATHGLILGLATLASLQAWDRGGRPGLVGVAGLLLGLAFLTRASLFLADALAAAVMVVALLLAKAPEARRQAGGRLAWLGLGFCVPVAVAFVLLATRMPAGDAWRGTLGTWPAILSGDVTGLHFYQRLSGLDRPAYRLAEMGRSLAGGSAVLAAAAALAFAARRWRLERPWMAVGAFLGGAALLSPVPAGVWLDGLAALPLFVAIAAASRLPALRRGGREAARAGLALSFATLAFVLLGRMLLHARVYHYGFSQAAPAAVLSIVAVLGWLPAELERRGASGRTFRAAVLGILAVATVAHLQRTASHVGSKSTVVGSGADAFRAGRRGLYVNEALERLRERPPGTLAVLPEGVMLNYLARRRAPTRHLNFMPPELAILGGEATVLDELEASPPAWVAIVHKDLSEYGYRRFGDDYATGLFDWLMEDYVPFATIARSPLVPGKRFGIALLEPRPGAHSPGSSAGGPSAGSR